MTRFVQFTNSQSQGIRNSMPPLVLIQTMISNDNMTGTLRSQKSQSWEVVEPTLTQEPSVFSEICRDRRPSCLPSGVCGLMVDVQVLVVDPRGKKPEG